MRQQARWGLWRYEERDGKPTKVPYRLDGNRARSTVAEDWAGFPAVAAHFVRVADSDGIGFRLGEGWAGVDLDHCIVGGEPLSWARSITEILDSYSEYSPSGTGIKVFLLGRLPAGERRRTGNIEMYDAGRYFTVTGQHVPGTPQEPQERTGELLVVHQRTFPEDRPASRPPVQAVYSRDDQEIIDRARAAKNGAAFDQLWRGDISAYSSHSEADLALAAHLSYWAEGDAATVDRLFRASGLYREKWDEQHGAGTYGEITTGKATTGRPPVRQRFSGPIGL